MITLRKYLLKLLISIAFGSIGSVLYGYDLEYQGIYYNIIDWNKLEVTTKALYDPSNWDQLNNYVNSYIESSIFIPDSLKIKGKSMKVTSIAEYAFFRCANLEYIRLSSNLDSIGKSAFEGCDKLLMIDNFEVCPLKFIPESMCQGCSSLTDIVLPNSVEIIDRFAFFGANLSRMQRLPEKLESICDYAFRGTLVSDIQFDKPLTGIGVAAFNGSAIRNLRLPEGFTGIGDFCFSNTPIEDIFIPETTCYIGSGGFGKLPYLRNVICMIEDPNSVQGANATYIFEYFMSYDDCVLWVPKNSIQLYKEHRHWSCFKNIRAIESGLDEDAGVNCSKIWLEDGKLRVEGPEGSSVKIYNLTGNLVVDSKLNDEQISFSLPKGVYIVVGKDLVKKIQL